MTMPTTTLLSSAEIEQTLQQMAQDIRSHLAASDIKHPAIIGIHTGGAWLAQRLHEQLDCDCPLGLLDINFHRDDFSRNGVKDQVKPSTIEFSVDDRDLVLIDDVLASGRTVRAAINEIFDFGRPRSVTLACLVDRGGRQLPIQADVVGIRPELPSEQQIKLIGPDSLELQINTAE